MTELEHPSYPACDGIIQDEHGVATLEPECEGLGLAGPDVRDQRQNKRVG